MAKSPETVILVYDAIGKLIAKYSTQPAPTNPTTSYTVTDQLGSPRVIRDSNGQVTSRRDFMPFGEELASDSNYRKANDFKYGQIDSVRQRFTGYQKDSEPNLDFAEARMYENRHGRFTAVDPLLASGKSANPQTFNRYVCAGNNPVNFTDPDGLEWHSRTDKETGLTSYRWFGKNDKVETGCHIYMGSLQYHYEGNTWVWLNLNHP
jgi:RHS repeat-associated protein